MLTDGALLVLFFARAPAFFFLLFPYATDEPLWTPIWDQIYGGLLVAAQFTARVVLVPVYCAVWLFGWAVWFFSWVGLLLVPATLVGLLYVLYAVRWVSPTVCFGISRKTWDSPVVRTADHLFLPVLVHASVYTANPALVAPYTLYLAALYAYIALTSFFDLSLLRGLIRTGVWSVWRLRGWETAIKGDEEAGGATEKTRLLEEENAALREQLRAGGQLAGQPRSAGSTDTFAFV
ncbi:hypothetical protein JCM6882_000951 [Rhodosporidiobolus microsporus]